LFYSSNATGQRGVLYRTNGSGDVYAAFVNATAANGCVVPYSFVVSLVAGDYIEIIAEQNSGSTLTLSATHSYVGAVRVGYQTNPADLPGTYIASMYAANSGSPTHTSSGGWQKVGSGGGTLTWTSEIDKRPSGVSAQVDTATNKRIDIRKTGLYRVGWSVAFDAMTDGKIVASAVYKNGSGVAQARVNNGASTGAETSGSKILSLTSGDYLELYGYQNDSVSEAYNVGASYANYLQAEYLGPAT